MKFLKSIRLFGFFSCFLLSKIAYNQRKEKNRLNNCLKAKNRSKRKYERKNTHDNSPKTNIRPFSSCVVWIFNFQSFSNHSKTFPLCCEIDFAFGIQKGEKIPNRTKISHHSLSKKMVFFQDTKNGQDNTQKEKNVHFLSGGVLCRRLN